MGRRKLPIWAVVAADSRFPRDGRYIEDLGRYYPLEEPARVELNNERIMHWLEVGAQPSDTVRSILSRQGLLLALHLKRKGKSEDEIQEAVEAHRQRHAEKAEQAIAVTAKARRQKALEEEAKEAARLAEEEAKARAEAEAKKKAEEEARRKAEAEARKKAEEEAKAKAEAAEAEEAEAKAEEAKAEEAEAEEAEAG